MKYLLIILIWTIPIVAYAENSDFIGTWSIEPVSESKDQFPWWRQIKYPKSLKVTFAREKYKIVFIDQYGNSCKGEAKPVNINRELIFEYCGTLGTKSSTSWGSIHHAKIVNGKLHGVVTSNQFLFSWVGEKQ